MAQVFDIDLDDDDHDSPAPSHVSKPFKSHKAQETIRVSPSIWRSGRSSASGFLYDGPRPKPLKALPSANMSKTEREDPIFVMPYMLTVDPKRMKLRSDRALPRDTKSSTLRVEPSVIIP